MVVPIRNNSCACACCITLNDIACPGGRTALEFIATVSLFTMVSAFLEHPFYVHAHKSIADGCLIPQLHPFQQASSGTRS